MTTHYKITRFRHHFNQMVETLKPCMNYKTCHMIKFKDENGREEWVDYPEIQDRELNRYSSAICDECLKKENKKLEDMTDFDFEPN